MGFFIGSGVILKQKDRYVLVQEVRHEKAGYYNLPAGTLELGEDLLQCAVREVQEETGAMVTLESFIGLYETVIATGSNVVFAVFSGSIPDEAVLQSEEHKVIKVLSYTAIEALDEAGQLRSPIVLKSISNYQNGQRLPINTVQTWHVETLASITVEKGH
jgi:8-oxo-dGTP pyrophosphatase MutT (NUDIX family)